MSYRRIHNIPYRINRHNTSIARWFRSFTNLLVIAFCFSGWLLACGSDKAEPECYGSADCQTGQICINGVCSGSSTGDGDSDQSCEEGDATICTCANGAPGLKECLASGSWGSCECEISLSDGDDETNPYVPDGDEDDQESDLLCVPYSLRLCTCNSGASGTQFCLEDGQSWDICRCSSSTDGDDESSELDAEPETVCLPDEVRCDGDRLMGCVDGDWQLVRNCGFEGLICLDNACQNEIDGDEETDSK